MDLLDRLDAIVARLKTSGWQERDAIKEELLALVKANRSDTVVQHLETTRKELPLEIRWDIDEVLEATAPPPPSAEPEPEPEPEGPADGRLRMSDLKVVYEDPRGLVLFVDKKTGSRWFAQQPDPYTGQPVLMEVPPTQVEAVKAQLRGSPYWRLGSGVVG